MSRRISEEAFFKRLAVDPADNWMLRTWNWRPFYTKTSGPYASASMKIDGKWVKRLLHRFVVGAPPRTPVEHLDNDGLNCRRSNLLISNQRSNILRAHPTGGVYKKGRQWVVQLGNKYRGGFPTKAEAEAHRDKLRRSKICQPS